jgi:hypothetical protein
MSLAPIPTGTTIADKTGRLSDDYISWFQSIQQWLAPQGQTGITSARPTNRLYVGLGYFDTTLGYMVWVKQVSPSIVWVRYDGTTV